jgi:hypothetical protein
MAETATDTRQSIVQVYTEYISITRILYKKGASGRVSSGYTEVLAKYPPDITRKGDIRKLPKALE